MPIVTTSSRRRPGRRPTLPTAIAAIAIAAVVALVVCLREDPASSGPKPPSGVVTPSAASRDGGAPAPAPSALQPANPSVAAPGATAASGMEQAMPSSAHSPTAPDRPPAHPPAPGGVFSDHPDAIRDLPGRITLSDGNVMTFPPPDPGKTISVSAQGRVYLADSAGNFIDATPPPIFDNAIEEQMVGISTPGGHFVPGLFLANSPSAITNMLYKDVVVNDGDSDDVKAKKEAVAETKQLMLSYLDAGYSLPEVVMAIAELAEQERSFRRKGISTIMRMIREGDVEGARAYRETLDEVAASQQLAPIILPKRVSEALHGGQPQANGN